MARALSVGEIDQLISRLNKAREKLMFVYENQADIAVEAQDAILVKVDQEFQDVSAAAAEITTAKVFKAEPVMEAAPATEAPAEGV